MLRHRPPRTAQGLTTQDLVAPRSYAVAGGPSERSVPNGLRLRYCAAMLSSASHIMTQKRAFFRCSHKQNSPSQAGQQKKLGEDSPVSPSFLDLHQGQKWKVNQGS